MDKQLHKAFQKLSGFETFRGLWRTLPYFIIVFVTIIVFFPSLQDGFTNWDDDSYVTDNPDIRGFTSANIKKIFSSTYASNFQPFTMLTYMVEASLFGLNPVVFHCTNLILHIVNALLVFVLLRSLTGSQLASAVAALLFAIHPLRVESVAWVAERKDVLSALFYLLSFLAYWAYLRKKDRKNYWFCLLSLLFSLLAKPMAVSLPFILLLFDFLHREKMDKVLLHKAPFFAVAAIFVIITVLTQHHAGAINTYPALPLLQRICVPFYGLLFYIGKFLVPVKLVALYPMPAQADIQMKTLVLASPFIVVAGAGLLYFLRPHSKRIIFGLLFYSVALLPVLQIIPIGSALVADRYSYIPHIGVCFIIADLLARLTNPLSGRNLKARIGVYVFIMALFVLFGFLSFQRCLVWNNSMTLWNDTIGKYPSAIAYNNRGTAYGNSGKTDEAIADFSLAVSFDQGMAKAYNNRGLAYLTKGIVESALSDFDRTILLDPRYYDAYNNRGIIYGYLNDLEKALADFTRAIAIRPEYARSYTNRGIAYMRKGAYDLALRDFESAIARNPTDTAAREKRDEARAVLQKAR